MYLKQFYTPFLFNNPIGPCEENIITRVNSSGLQYIFFSSICFLSPIPGFFDGHYLIYFLWHKPNYHWHNSLKRSDRFRILQFFNCFFFFFFFFCFLEVIFEYFIMHILLKTISKLGTYHKIFIYIFELELNRMLSLLSNDTIILS